MALQTIDGHRPQYGRPFINRTVGSISSPDRPVRPSAITTVAVVSGALPPILPLVVAGTSLFSLHRLDCYMIVSIRFNACASGKSRHVLIALRGTLHGCNRRHCHGKCWWVPSSTLRRLRHASVLCLDASWFLGSRPRKMRKDEVQRSTTVAVATAVRRFPGVMCCHR